MIRTQYPYNNLMAYHSNFQLKQVLKDIDLNYRSYNTNEISKVISILVRVSNQELQGKAFHVLKKILGDRRVINRLIEVGKREALKAAVESLLEIRETIPSQLLEDFCREKVVSLMAWDASSVDQKIEYMALLLNQNVIPSSTSAKYNFIGDLFIQGLAQDLNEKQLLTVTKAILRWGGTKQDVQKLFTTHRSEDAPAQAPAVKTIDHRTQAKPMARPEPQGRGINQDFPSEKASLGSKPNTIVVGPRPSWADIYDDDD